MSFCFRVCFNVPGEGSFTSDDEFITFAAKHLGLELRFASGSRGVSIGKNDRFSISGGPFNTPEEAQLTAEKVRVALLRRAVQMRRGLDLGQQSLKGFQMSAYDKQHMANLLNVPAVQEDHLGITVFSDDPKPQFVRMNMKGVVSSQAQTLVDELSESIGKYKYATEKAEIAAGIYAISHFVGRAPARFLLMFVSLEALFDPGLRSDDTQKHVQALISATHSATISEDEKDAISSQLSFLKKQSIAQTGRDLAATLLEGKKYESMDPDVFFGHIYKMRNNLVHYGQIDPAALHGILGEMDRFVSDILQAQYVEP